MPRTMPEEHVKRTSPTTGAFNNEDLTSTIKVYDNKIVGLLSISSQNHFQEELRQTLA